MVPKKIYPTRRAKKVFTPTRANPIIFEEIEKGASEEDEKLMPPLNQEELNPSLDGVIFPPASRIRKGATPTSSAFSDADALGTTTQNCLFEQQANQRE